MQRLEGLNEHELRRQLVSILTEQKLGLVWERDVIARDEAINADVVLPEFVEELSCRGDGAPSDQYQNLIIEGDNFDSLRLLKSTHANKIRVIYIDPPYNTGNKDWVYNDSFVGQNDKWRHSQWLEFLYQRLELARDLLTPDGVILVSINDENRDRLGMLMDEVFPGMRMGSITWRTRQGSNADQSCFLSVDHEHVLVYGNPGFNFNGFDKSYEMYSNDDEDPRGDWRTSDLTLGFSYKERPNLYYPLKDESTGAWYPPNPERIWVYASEARLKPGQTVQTKTMEEFARLGQILFPKDQKVVTWNTMEELLAAIDAGEVPRAGKTSTLRRDLPGLDFWVGKPVGFGRPAFKRYKADLRNQTQPLSSWIVPSFEEGTYEAENNLASATNQEGARQVAEVFGDRAFNYAKPSSLIKGLLSQASKPGDIVLDFFAGSGTTALAILELNSEDAGSRRFILCSSTEANTKEKTKNICRDVTAERIRRIINGYGKTKGLGGNFAYLRTSKIPPEDARMDSTDEQAFHLLSLRNTLSIRPYPDGPIKPVFANAELAIVYLPQVNATSIKALTALPQSRLAVYSARPETVAEKLETIEKEGNSYAIGDAILMGQAGNMAGAVSEMGAEE